MYATLGSVAAGLVVSVIRWIVIDAINHETGIPEPKWNFADFEVKRNAFDGLVENHYRYYQFNANMLVAAAFTYAARLVSLGVRPSLNNGIDWGFLLLEIAFWVGSRDSLKKYYLRTADLLGTTQRRSTTTNGYQQHEEKEKPSLKKTPPVVKSERRNLAAKRKKGPAKS